MPKLTPSESQAQVAYFHWISIKSRSDRKYEAIFAIPNGGKRNIITATRMKAEGLRPGIPDIFISVPSKGYHGLYIEVKKKGGKIAPLQKKYLELFQSLGYLCKVCYSLAELIQVTEEYLD